MKWCNMSVVKTSVTINATLTSVKWHAMSVVRTSLTTNAAWHLGVFVPSRLSGTQHEEGWVGGQKIYSRTHHERSCTSKWWSRWKVNNENQKTSNFNGSWLYVTTDSKTSTACLRAGFKLPLLYCTWLWSISERGFSAENYSCFIDLALCYTPPPADISVNACCQNVLGLLAALK